MPIKQLPLADTTLSYVDEGSGPVVLLIHGFPLDASMWSAQVEALAGSHRVIAPDLRGFGSSPLTNDPARQDELQQHGVTMEQYADDLAALLQGIAPDEQVVYVGFSMGGYIGWQFERKYRDSLRALVVMDSRALPDNEEAAQGRHKLAEQVLLRGSDFAGQMMEPKLFAAETLQNAPQIVQPVRDVIAKTNPKSVAAALLGMAKRPDATAWLSEIDVPLLCIVGVDDAISRAEEMQDIASTTGGQCDVIPNAGHMAPVENPAAVNQALLNFLAKLST